MLVSTASSIGGMERIVCSLARGLTDRGFQVRTFFPHSGNAAELLRWCEDQGVEAETHPAVLDAADPHSLTGARRFARLVRSVDPDVVNVHYGDNFLSIWDVVGVRTAGRRGLVVSIHHPTEWDGSSRRKRLLTGLGSRATSAVATFATATRQVLRDAGVPSGRLHVIPCGVSVPSRRVDRDEARRALGLPVDSFVVGSLARLVEHKGIDRLIAAMDREELAGSILAIGGDGPLFEQLQEQAEGCAHIDVRLLGRLPDTDPLFAACDVFALPSELEGFGLVYIEAAMHGVPSIGTRVGGVPDAVVDGETGLLVAPGDDAGLGAALVQLRSDVELRTRLGQQARTRALGELTDEVLVDRYVQLFDEFCGFRSSG
jgi:glycosyltransferase involved in cell wall biosynthesis